MIEKTGTGAHTTEALSITIPAPGFYTLGVHLEATGIPAGNVGLSLSASSPSPIPLSAAVTNGQPKTSNILAPFYAEPGAVFSFLVNPFGNYGANPPAAWNAKFWLNDAHDIS